MISRSVDLFIPPFLPFQNNYYCKKNHAKIQRHKKVFSAPLHLLEKYAFKNQALFFKH